MGEFPTFGTKGRRLCKGRWKSQKKAKMKKINCPCCARATATATAAPAGVECDAFGTGRSASGALELAESETRDNMII